MSLFTNICKTRALRLQKLVWFACRRVHEEVVPGYYNPFDLIKWQNEKPIYEETVLTACSLKHVDFGDSGTVLHAQRYFHDRRDNVVDIDEYDHIQREHLTCINFDLMSLYVHGFQNLMDSGVFRLVADNLPIPPEVYNTDLVKSVKTLHTFLQNIEYHEDCLYELLHFQEEDGLYSDSAITALLTNHLFSPLTSSNPKYVSSTRDDIETRLPSCPCTDGCGTKMDYYDYEIGNEGLGFIRPSVLLYPHGGGVIAINKAEEMPRNIYGEGMSHMEQLRLVKNKQKMASHAVIMSHYNHHLQIQEKGRVVSTLIPTIFTTWKYFDIYMYDSEKDIFLKTFYEPTPIFKYKSDGVGFENKFNISAIFQLWMLINHSLLKPDSDISKSLALSNVENSFGLKLELEYNKLPEFRRQKLLSPKVDDIENNFIDN